MTQLTARGELVIGSLTARGETVIGSLTATGRIVFPASTPTEIGDGYDWYQEWPGYRPQKRQEPKRETVRNYRRGVVAMAARFSGRAWQAFRRGGAAGVSGHASGAVQQRIGDELWLFGIGSDEDDLLFGARTAAKAARDAVDRLLDSVDSEARRWAQDATADEAAVKTDLGQKLMDIRNRYIADGGALLSEDEIEAEVKARRGDDAVKTYPRLFIGKKRGEYFVEHELKARRGGIDALLDSVDDEARAWAQEAMDDA